MQFNSKNCLICRTFNVKFVPIRQETVCPFEGFEVSAGLKEVFEKITGVELLTRPPNDYLLCQKCFDRVNDAYLLRLQAQRAFSGLSNSACELKEVKSELAVKVEPEDNQKPVKKLYERLPEAERYRCHFCPRSYSGKKQILRHLRDIHLPSKTYKCKHPGCEETFTRLVLRNNHSESEHEGQRSFICEQCGATFPRSNKLEIHRRIHSNERPFRCDFEGCPSAFKQKIDLKTHIKSIHSDERPHACEFCGQTFKIINTLLAHQRRKHTLSNMKQCVECGKLYLTVSELNDHMAVQHLGHKKYVCKAPNCKHSYTRAFHLRRHIANVHAEMYEEMLANGVFRKTRRNMNDPYHMRIGAR